MNRKIWILGCLCLALGVGLCAGEAGAQCPPGYFWSGPQGCMPAGPPVPMAPPPPPPDYYAPRPCPPGTVWGAGGCRPVPPPPGYGITINVPPIYIRP